jgi:hypothetical protein
LLRRPLYAKAQTNQEAIRTTNESKKITIRIERSDKAAAFIGIPFRTVPFATATLRQKQSPSLPLFVWDELAYV